MARSFNGSSDYIDCGSSLSLGNAQPWTAAAWVKIPGTSGSNRTILAKATGTVEFQFYVENVTNNLGMYNGGSNQSANPLSNNVWQHAAGTSDGSGALLYVNAVSVSRSACTTGSGSGSTVLIGAQSSGVQAIDGQLADVALWNVVLTASEIAALASGVRPYRIRRKNLVAYWPLEGSASPEPDVIGGNNGTLTGTSSAANPFNYTTPKYGSRVFNGSSDKIDCGNSSTLNPTTAMTFSAWIYPTSFPNAYNSILRRLSDGTHYYSLEIKSNGKIAFYYRDSTTADVNYDGTGTYTLSANTLYHIAFVCPASAAGRAYLNANLDGTTGGAPTGVATISASTFIGLEEGGSNGFAGRIADAAIWNLELSTAELAKLYAGFRPHQVRSSGLVAYWPLEGTASPEPDMIAGNNGTLTGTSQGASPTTYQDVVGA